MSKENTKQNELLIIDATNVILGRLGAKIAKLLLNGKKVVIVNAEKAVISGNPETIIQKYKERWGIHSRTNPRKGPFHYSRPDLFVKRTIRGMLPWKKTRGREAYKRLKVFIGLPPEYSDANLIRFEDLNAEKRLKHKWIYVGDLLKNLGWKGITEY